MNFHKYSYILTLSCCIFIFYSCKKEELPVSVHNPGNVTTATVNMAANYKWQIFYNLKTNTVVSQNLKTSWDLGFESAAKGYHIILNTSKVMFASNKKISDFSKVIDTIGVGANKKCDTPSGNLDSTAIGNWQNTNYVYIIDRGYNETGIHQGFKKIQFQQVDADKYTIRFANLNGTEDKTLFIKKDSAYNLQFLSFTINQMVYVEPPKAMWDLVFTQYTHLFYNPTTPYLVTGCLLNHFSTQAVMDSITPFPVITYHNASNRTLFTTINSIGYNWKTYTGDTYITNSKMCYIIKTSEGIYYKLHFIDYFNSTGTKGNPKWEFQKL